MFLKWPNHEAVLASLISLSQSGQSVPYGLVQRLPTPLASLRGCVHTEAVAAFTIAQPLVHVAKSRAEAWNIVRASNSVRWVVVAAQRSSHAGAREVTFDDGRPSQDMLQHRCSGAVTCCVGVAPSGRCQQFDVSAWPRANGEPSLVTHSASLCPLAQMAKSKGSSTKGVAKGKAKACSGKAKALAGKAKALGGKAAKKHALDDGQSSEGPPRGSKRPLKRRGAD